ncbi:RluA family pseudouridine synthase [Lignipirellula cremea]|uniref:Pseudouridine synthase n=1 Tax=Lignipirellula cremea TaxID=2528010 RepID=A0A518DUG0_9BACT|nr:RluA family pseudouridine synthase [Lignipirellula cremea]QDU95470.1 Pseudouridine synthase [Lignipirellula cremea]
MMELSEDAVDVVVPEDQAGARLDVFLASHFSRHSRVQLRRAISAGTVSVDGAGAKPSYRLLAGQVVRIALPDLPREGPRPENIPLDVVFEDESLAVVNKPRGMVVHPGKGHWEGTLTSALAFRFENLSTTGGATRPGIVHRLDRDTTGVLVVAKNDITHTHLAAQFQDRTVEKVYAAIVSPSPDRDADIIEKPIGPHPHQRDKMAIREHHASSREAKTFYEVEKRFRGFALLRVFPKTGRTHQIRVHLAHVGCPVLCDRLYGGRAVINRGEIEGTSSDEMLLDRQALHARRLTFDHPHTGERMTFEAPLPPDMQSVLDALAKRKK